MSKIEHFLPDIIQVELGYIIHNIQNKCDRIFIAFLMLKIKVKIKIKILMLKIKVELTYTKNIDRQVAEAIKIKNSNADILMNSKA